MWLLNHLYNHCLEKLLDSHQPMPTMGHNLTYVQENFGALARMPILMWGFSTPMLPATAPEVCLLHTRNMKMKRKEHMASVYLKLNMAFLPAYTLNLVWEEKHKPSTSAWLTCCLWNVMYHTAPSWAGWDASCLLPSSDLQSCASEGADPPCTMSSDIVLACSEGCVQQEF